METENKIRVLVIHDKSGGEPDMCYRLDDKESALHCFDNLKNNFEDKEKHEFSVQDMTPEEWAECERIGEELS